MKRNVFVYVTGLFVACFYSTVIAQELPEELIRKTVTRLDSTKSTEDLVEIRGVFERIAVQYPREWLPSYYQAYIDILLFFGDNDPTRKEAWLQDAGKSLENMKKVKGLSKEERSEVHTLRGFWYYAQMSIDPAVNGAKYTSHVVSAYSDALKQNPGNPRAIILNAYFQQNLSSFMGGNYSAFDKDRERARELYEKQDKTTIFPHWYMEF